MASKSLSKSVSSLSPIPHLSPKPVTKNNLASTPLPKLSHSSLLDDSPFDSNPFNRRRQSALAMPSPVSTPGAEHLSDVSSCCSIDESDSNRGSPPGSPASSSFAIPISDLKKKYKHELWSAIRSDYRYLMTEEIIDTCRSTESDLSLESDDQSVVIADISFKDYLQQYKELNHWLESVRQRTQRQSDCRSEKYVNQTFHEDMLNHLTSLKHFKEYAKQLMRNCPRLKDDITQHLKEVNSKWEALEKLLLPDARQSDQVTMLSDMELDLDRLRCWVDDMDVMRRNWRLRSHWTAEDIECHLANQLGVQAQVESRSKVVRSLLSLCERFTNSELETEEQKRAVDLKRNVTAIEKECNQIWLDSLEWQMTLEDAKNNGIHLRHNVEDDQWDRMRSSIQRKQQNELPTVQEDSSDFVNDDDSFYMNRSAGKVRSDDSNIEESFSEKDEDDGNLYRSYREGAPMRSDRRSFSDPVLNIDSSDTKICEDAIVPELDGLKGKLDNGFSREWSPGQLRRCGAIDLVAAFDDKKLEQPVDVGYASGSHSNEETDSSARQEVYILSPSQARGTQRLNNTAKDALNCLHGSANLEQNIVWTAGDHQNGCRSDWPEMEARQNVSEGMSNTVLEVAGKSSDEIQDDRRSILETEDEMSLELPFDDVPVIRASDQHLEGVSGPPKKKPQKTAFRRSLFSADESSTSEALLKGSKDEANAKKSVLATLKGKCAKEEAVDGMRSKKKKVPTATLR